MKINRARLAGLFALAAALVGALAWPTTKPLSPPSETSPSQPAASAGLKLHLDPVTGRVVPAPANAAPDAAAAQMFKSSHEGLIEEPGTTAAGGFKVDARGRFQSAVTVSVGADGKPVLNCVDGKVATTPAR